MWPGVCAQAQTAKGTGSAASRMDAARVGVACGAMGEPAAIGCADTPNIQATPGIQHGGFAPGVVALDPARCGCGAAAGKGCCDRFRHAVGSAPRWQHDRNYLAEAPACA